MSVIVNTIAEKVAVSRRDVGNVGQECLKSRFIDLRERLLDIKKVIILWYFEIKCRLV